MSRETQTGGESRGTREQSRGRAGFDWERARQHIASVQAALAGADQVGPEKLERVWAERAEQLAKVPVQEDEGEKIELAVFRLAGETYGIEAMYISGITPATQITPVPRVPDWLAGVVNLRGRILSVLDLRRFFGLADAAGDGGAGEGGPPDENRCLLVVENSDMELALLVDDVLAVESLPASRVQDPRDTLQRVPLEYVRGVAEPAGGDAPGGGIGLMAVLNLQAMLADERLIVDEEMS